MAAGSQDSPVVAVLAEKPSVARDIARVVGATKQGEGYLHGNGHIVTWAIGHLVALAQPHEIRPEWRHWRRDLLPMLPADWPLVVYEKTKDQFEVVRRILNSPKVARIVCATDAGREGELIFRYIYEASGCTKPFSRLWISSLTPEAIRKGLASVKDGKEYDRLADAARGRSRADWLVGMNLSRLYSLAYRDELSVGRVQTPTLAMVVERELEIRAFVPEDYLEVVATFSPDGIAGYKGTWFRSGEDARDRTALSAAMRLPAGGEEAGRIVERARRGQARIESIEPETRRTPPPELYDLTELQRHANRLFGFSAQKTLDLAQSLYERHKLISYPRTDSRHLSRDVASTLPRIVDVIRDRYEGLLAPGTGERALGRRFVDDAKVTDHHAIIPTPTSPAGARLDESEARIYDLVCRRLLSAWHDDYIAAITTVITAIHTDEIIDRYHSSGTAVRQQGWKVLEPAGERAGKKKGRGGAETAAAEEAQALPPGLETGQPQTVQDVEAVRKTTRPPKRFTEATLLTAMETAGRTLDEKELSDAMKESGLGTPATRAAIIEVLLKRQYIERQGKSLAATEKGIRLIQVVHPEVKTPAMTGQWEARLRRIERGEARLAPFLESIEEYVREVVGKGAVAPPARAAAASSAAEPPPAGPAVETPVASPEAQAAAPAAGRFLDLLRSAFGFESFRPNQEAVCRSLVAGRDVLLVMPTGSGKSLCYQFPAIARGGTALVVSPLIALMEDQVAKLKERGFAAERIHSGRDRAASRQVCIDYLNGRLQFLYIAPERLRIPGFAEMLARRKPCLVAIDEAHCISQWGHDFRPDYRRIGEHLPSLRPAPVIALTATATPLVQEDIATQLGLQSPGRFIHGFRRRNIAIEIVECPPGERTALTLDLLLEPGRRPAIVYVPTRKMAEGCAAGLNRHFPSGAYHAGLEPARRDRVQAEFLDGRLEVIVATIAFGMGVDKPDIRSVIHLATPASIEGYYQEVGRAGRDGLPSRAVLMHSWADRHTHEFFFERDYPDVSVLETVAARLSDQALPKDVLAGLVRLPPEVFETALEKLWIHGGAQIDYAENVARGHDHWRQSYQEQAEHKLAQLNQMLWYAGANACRMLGLVRHFGDQDDSQEPCGICDFCVPEACVAQRFRPAGPEETQAARRVLEALKTGPRPTGRLHTDLFGGESMDRHSFELLLGSLARAGLIELQDCVFQKGGRKIEYRKAALTAAGLEASGEELSLNMKAPIKSSGPGLRRKGKRKAKPPAPRPEPAKKKPAGDPVEQALRGWRLEEARRRGVPAFRILTDRALEAIAGQRPQTIRDLLAIPGVSLSVVEKYGAQIFALVHR
ncbi:MAG: DNA topoisomerase 3 [Bryobacterales bacterium]|nr:DNA topoisomerase 3 [Bryobacterales bacterium]